MRRLSWLCEQRVGKYARRCAWAKGQKSLSLRKRGHWATMARVMTSGSLSRAGRPLFGGRQARSSFHQSSTSTYNETKKESRSMATPSFGESLVQHTVLAPSPLLRITHQPSKKFAKKSPNLAHLRDAPTPTWEHDMSVA